MEDPPELTVGGWYVWDVIDPFGAKILVGFSTKDKVWRVGVGAQYAGGGWVPIAEIEYNPILGRMLLSAQVADEAVTTGATSSASALGVTPSATPKAKTATPAKTQVKAETHSDSPFGWVQDVQTTTSTGSGQPDTGGHTTSSTTTPTGSSGRNARQTETATL